MFEKYNLFEFCNVYKLGSENEIKNDVKKVPGVIEANKVFGIYDIIVRLSADSIDNPKELIKSSIKKI